VVEQGPLHRRSLIAVCVRERLGSAPILGAFQAGGTPALPGKSILRGQGQATLSDIPASLKAALLQRNSRQALECPICRINSDSY
jgi:hypothetical protein